MPVTLRAEALSVGGAAPTVASQRTELRCRMTGVSDPLGPFGPARGQTGASEPAPSTTPTPPAPPARSRARRAATAGRRSLPFAGGILAALIAVGLYNLVNPPPRPLTTNDVNQAVASALASQTPAPARSELVYAAIRGSVVLIQVDETADGPAAHGLGTGVVVNDQGAILTALHVVDGATAIRLTYPDGSTSTATITSRQPASDIAVLQPQTVPQTVVPATLGNPGGVRIGSEAYIVGNPFGLYGSLSAGVVSGLDRSFQAPGSSTVLHGLIQVDAAVNPGNSGGPLLDRDGRVVGIVTALVNPTNQDVFIGIGLAVPIDVAGGAAGLPAY
jgi:S1-C subfamily serine protease